MSRSFFERFTGGSNTSTRDGAEEKKSISEPPAKAKQKDIREEKPSVMHPAGDGETGAILHDGDAPSVEEGQLTVDIYDDGTSIVVQSTVAGAKPEEIDISFEDNMVTIRGARRRQQEVGDDNFYYRELYWGAFSRSIILPEEIDFSKADAAIKNGLLTLRLPKKDRSAKKLRVKTE